MQQERFLVRKRLDEGIRLRDCLNTDDRKEAQKRLADLYIQVERGEYQQAKEKFDDRANKYDPVSLKGIYKGQPNEDKKRILGYHLLPRFKGKTVVQVEEELEAWVEETSKACPDSTCKKRFQVMTELGFEFSKVEGLEGKSFDRDQILTEKNVLRVIQDHVMPHYRTLCLVASYSGLRLKNVAELRKKDVNLRSGWLKVNQSKTDKVVEVPITATLRAVFSKDLEAVTFFFRKSIIKRFKVLPIFIFWDGRHAELYDKIMLEQLGRNIPINNTPYPAVYRFVRQLTIIDETVVKLSF